jgi:hypothetical protein
MARTVGLPTAMAAQIILDGIHKHPLRSMYHDASNNILFVMIMHV